MLNGFIAKLFYKVVVVNMNPARMFVFGYIFTKFSV